MFSGIREPKGKFSRMVPNQTLSSSASHSEHNNYSTISCWIETFPRERLLIVSATSNWTLFPLFFLPFNCWIDMTVRSPSLDGCRAHTKTHRHSTRYWERDAKFDYLMIVSRPSRRLNGDCWGEGTYATSLVQESDG